MQDGPAISQKLPVNTNASTWSACPHEVLGRDRILQEGTICGRVLGEVARCVPEDMRRVKPERDTRCFSFGSVSQYHAKDVAYVIYYVD
jgi:hypothetical protein